jgi:hypothetical protein
MQLGELQHDALRALKSKKQKKSVQCKIVGNKERGGQNKQKS